MENRNLSTLTDNRIEEKHQMKTFHITLNSVRLSQSEAMLEAMQVGFFEISFEKTELTALLSDPRCHFIRFQFLSKSKNERTLAAIALARDGGTIQSAANYLLGKGSVHFKASSHCVDFHAGDVLQLIRGFDSAGIRLFPGRQRTLIAVGIDSRGFDMEWGAGYIRSQQIQVSHFA